MAGAITLGQHGILGLQNDVAVFIDEQSAKGMVAVLSCLARNGDGDAQIF